MTNYNSFVYDLREERCERKEYKFPIVIDRYKMPGLNREGTAFAEDMCYGYGYEPRLPIYQSSDINSYIADYEAAGFDARKYGKFANISEEGKSIAERKSQRERSTEVGIILPEIVVSARLSKPVYTWERMVSANYNGILTGLDIRIFNKLNDTALLWDFRETAKLYFAMGDLENNLDAMIDKFARKEGGIYESTILNNAISISPQVRKYCDGINAYLREQLIGNGWDISALEDKHVYFTKDSDLKLRKKKNKHFENRPIFNTWEDRVKGTAIALNDIWATEVKVTSFHKTRKHFEVTYQVTLWDHFGLDITDMEKIFNVIPSVGETFVCWFILQHLRGYIPFITKITFNHKYICYIR